MAQLSEPQSPAFIVVVTGRGLQATALAVLLSAPIAVVAAHRDPDCVVIVGADEPRVRAVVATHPRALVLAVSPSASAAAMLAAGAAACVTDADPRLIAARLRALWRRFSSGQPQQREDAAPAGLMDRGSRSRAPALTRTGHAAMVARQYQPVDSECCHAPHGVL